MSKEKDPIQAALQRLFDSEDAISDAEDGEKASFQTGLPFEDVTQYLPSILNGEILGIPKPPIKSWSLYQTLLAGYALQEENPLFSRVRTFNS